MLGKLYITSNSSTEKLQGISDLVAEAIDAKVATDTTTKNALNKYQLALSKVLGEVHSARSTIEDQPMEATIADNEAKMEEVSEVDNTTMQVDEEQAVSGAQDSLLEELLDDEDEGA